MVPNLGLKVNTKPGYFQKWEKPGFFHASLVTSLAKLGNLRNIPAEREISAFFTLICTLIIEIHIHSTIECITCEPQEVQNFALHIHNIMVLGSTLHQVTVFTYYNGNQITSIHFLKVKRVN
jgi:hypothetical protein